MPNTDEQKQAEKDRKDESKSVKCDNHPDRDAKTYDADGAIAPVNWCDECTPRWYKNDDNG